MTGESQWPANETREDGSRGGGQTTRAVRQNATPEAIGVFHQVGWRVDPRTGCLLWNGPRTPNGYGMIRANGRRILVHRFALELTLGRPIGDGMMALHSCGNKLCAAPHHIREGSRAENAQDRLAEGGYFGATLTHCARGHEFTAENTRVYSGGDGRPRRKCLACHRQRAAAARTPA